MKAAAGGRSIEFSPVSSTTSALDEVGESQRDDSEGKSPQIRLSGKLTGRQSHMGFCSAFLITEPDPNSTCPTTALQRRLFYTVLNSEREEQLEEFLGTPGIKEAEVWQDGGTTVLHDIVDQLSKTTPR